MRALFTVLAVVAAAAAYAADVPKTPGAPVTGQVLEAKDAGGYTYLKLKTQGGETWAAVGKSEVKKGAQVTIEDPVVMTDFESKTLKQKFDRILFGNLKGAGAGGSIMAAHGSPHGAAPSPADIGSVKVPKATGRDARTVAEIVTQRAQLKDKTVEVRGKVVKFTGGVLGKNWIHLRDGSGSAAESTDDLVVTTADATRVGDVVIAKGVVHTDRDLGSGYAYKVLVEDARLTR